MKFCKLTFYFGFVDTVKDVNKKQVKKENFVVIENFHNSAENNRIQLPAKTEPCMIRNILKAFVIPS